LTQLYYIIPQKSNIAEQNMPYALDYVNQLPVEWSTFDSLRNSLLLVGVDAMEITVCPVDSGGYAVVAMPARNARKRTAIKSEKSGQLRCFKTVDAALRVCRQLGFSTVQVQL